MVRNNTISGEFGMSTHDTIRAMREIHKLSQEDMAEKLNMSPSGYSKIERGETKLYLDKLQQIAQIFNVDIVELLNTTDKNICFLISENSQSSSNYYGNNDSLIYENEKLKLELEYKDKIISQKDNEIESLKEIIALLKQK